MLAKHIVTKFLKEYWFSILMISILTIATGLIFGFKEFAFAVTLVMLPIGLGLTYSFYTVRKMEETPGIWTGLGILFTFISFLYVFKNADWGDIELSSLIPDISAAFTTSIVGLAMSKVIILTMKIKENKEDKEKEKKEEQPEQVLIAIRDNLGKMHVIFEELANRISSNVSQHIAENTEKIIEEFTEKTTDELNKITESNKNLSDVISQSAKDQIESINRNLGEVSKTFSEELNNNTDKFSELFNDNTDKLSKTFDRLEKWSNSSAERISSLNAEFKKLIEQQAELDDQQKEILELIKKQLNEIEKIRRERRTDMDLICSKLRIN